MNRTQAPSFVHAPVMVDEIMALADPLGPRRIIDCTVGGAGHAAALLSRYPDAELLGFDRDPVAVSVARERLSAFAGRATVVHSPFSSAAEHAQAHWPDGADFVLADFGVSSHQLDVAERGFSFRFAGPLDMRMDTTQGLTAAELINTLDAQALTRLLKTLGEERYARRIAHAILKHRPTTTDALQRLVAATVPAGPSRIDPATRTFQALRMAVNDELGEIDALLGQVAPMLRPGGLFIALSFHSLEDRAVKQALRAMSLVCSCPPRLPICGCHLDPPFELRHGKALKPTDTEIAQNPRSRSTRLRAAYRRRQR